MLIGTSTNNVLFTFPTTENTFVPLLFSVLNPHLAVEIENTMSLKKMLSHQFQVDKFFFKKRWKYLSREELSCQTIIKFRKFIKIPFFIGASFS